MLVRLLLVLGVSLALVGHAAAQEASTSAVEAAEARARTHFDAGTVFYEGEDYANALREFREAYDISSRPELLWNIALCHEHLGQYEEAYAALQRFGASGAPGHTVEAVDEALAALAPRVEEEQRNRANRVPIDVPPRPIDTTPYVAIAGFSVAALGVVGFAVFGALTLTEDAALTAECGVACTAERASSLGTYALIADLSAGVALAGAIIGVIGLVLAPSGSDASASLHVAPWASESGAGLVIGGTL